MSRLKTEKARVVNDNAGFRLAFDNELATSLHGDESDERES